MKRRASHPIIMFNPAECNVKNDDGKHVFVGKVYITENVNKNPEKVQMVLDKFPRLTSDEVLRAKDGVYTWILYSQAGKEDIQFVATEVVSPYEIGTRHQSLVYNRRVNAETIYGGGELMKQGDTINFNLLSGTYSKPLVMFEVRRAVSDEIVKMFKRFFPDATYDDSGDTYIRKVKHVPNELLDLYKEIGYTVRVFDTEAECAKFSNRFWHLDFGLEHYKKKLDTATNDDEKSTAGRLYAQALNDMIELLSNGIVKGGRRCTRRNKRVRN